MSTTTFLNARLCRSGVLVDDEKLVVSTETGKILSNTGHVEGNIIDLAGAIIAPGYLELQTNGVRGFHFTNFENEAKYAEKLEEAASFLATTGVTGFYPTIPTVPVQHYHKVGAALLYNNIDPPEAYNSDQLSKRPGLLSRLQCPSGLSSHRDSFSQVSSPVQSRTAPLYSEPTSKVHTFIPPRKAPTHHHSFNQPQPHQKRFTAHPERPPRSSKSSLSLRNSPPQPLSSKTSPQKTSSSHSATPPQPTLKASQPSPQVQHVLHTP